MKPQDYMAKCKERTEGYSWGSRIYVLLWAPGFNADSLKLDEIGGDETGANGLIKIIAAQANDNTHDCAPGTILLVNKTISVACGNKTTLEIKEIQKPGKNIISASAYLNGTKLSVGDKFGN